MPKTKTYTEKNAIELTEDTWKNISKEKKEELLISRGFDISWAKTKTIKEMVSRGGGMVARSLLQLEKAYIKENGGEVTVTWN